MSKQYSIADARTNLAAIVDEVEAGNHIELTRRGKAVAVVISRQNYSRLRSERPAFSDTYSSFLKRFRLKEVGVDDEFLEGLREAAVGRPVDL